MSTKPFHSVDSGKLGISVPDAYCIVMERLYEGAFPMKGWEIITGNHRCLFAFLLSKLNGIKGVEIITN